MIIFKNKYERIYNILIHNFLDVEGYPNNEIVEKIMSKYLYLEQYHRCLEVLSDLYNWTGSGFNYTLTPFHKLMLHKFLEYLAMKKTENKKFNSQYFNAEIKKIIDETVKLENTLCDIRISKQKFYNVSKFAKELFDDTDFLIIEQLYYDDTLDSYLIKNNEKIDLYYEILPYKTQQHFKTNYINILNKLEEALEFIISNSRNRNLGFMFWENDKPMKEPQIQVVLENIMDAYFCCEEIDITRESLLGQGKIDFRFYKNKNEKVLLEVKRASSSHLKSGYERQIIEYMKAWECRNAFYLVICFTDKDYTKAKKFIKECEQTHYYHSFINILILDARVENKKFKRVNKSKLNKEVPLKIDSYFKNIDRMPTLFKVDQIIKYLIVLKNNYNDIEDSNLKRDYVKKVRKVCYDDTYMILNIDRLINPDCFYQVIKSAYAPNKLLFKLISDDNLERDFNGAIDNIKGIYEQMEDVDDKDNLTEKQVNEIILFLKQEHNDFYKILQSISLRIYLFNKSNKYISFNTITNINLTEFVIVCYSVCKKHKYNKIYLFLNELGFILSCLVLKEFDNEIENLFKEFDIPYNKQDAQAVFSSFFTIYLMNNTKYQKYNFYQSLPQSVYIKLEKYFSKLLKNMIKEGQ